MPREVVEIDPSSLEDQRKLFAYCIHPNDANKRAAYLAAWHYQDRLTAEAEGKSAADLPWTDTKALAEQSKSAPEILAEAKTLLKKVTAASTMLERLFEDREVKVREGAANVVASEMRAYHDKKRQLGTPSRGTQTSETYVLSHMWTPYKPVVHLALAITQIQREALPEDLKSLSEEQVAELLWKAEASDQGGEVLKREPITAKEIQLLLEVAEQLRRAAIEHPKVTIEDADTIQFLLKVSASSKAF